MFDFTVKLKLSTFYLVIYLVWPHLGLGVGTLDCKGKGPFDSWQGHRKIILKLVMCRDGTILLIIELAPCMEYEYLPDLI